MVRMRSTCSTRCAVSAAWGHVITNHDFPYILLVFALPSTSGLIVRLGTIFRPLEPCHRSLLVQIGASHQLHPKGQASPVCSLGIPLQPFVGVLQGARADSGRLGSRVPTHSPSEHSAHLQIGLVRVPHPRPAFLGAVPAHGQGSHQQGQGRVDERVLRIHQEPHVLRPGVLRGRESNVRASSVPQGCGARPPTRYLCHAVQAPEGGLQMLILLGAEVGELEVLGYNREQTAQDHWLPHYPSPLPLSHQGRACLKNL